MTPHISMISRLYPLFLIPSLISAAFLVPKNCSIQPFSIPFGDVAILHDPQLPGAHRGLDLSFGSGKKRLSINVATTINATFLPDGPKICNSSDPAFRECVFWRGGLFSPQESTSWAKDMGTVGYNGSAENQGYDALHWDSYKGLSEDPLTAFPRGWDTMSFDTQQGKSIQMFGFPITIINNASFPFGAGMLGLASDSRFLDAAVAANITPSHTWGFDYGNIGAPASDGELVIGGYNPSRTNFAKAQNFTIFANKNIPCPLQVKVKSVKLDDVSLNTKTFTACIEPAVWALVLPLEVQTGFNKTVLEKHKGMNFVNATWEYFNYHSSSNDFPSSETMTFELDSGFSVTIPSNEIFEPRKIASLIHADYQQAGLGTAAFAPGTDPIVQLGGPFLSQVYLAVDYESGVFYLAPKNIPPSNNASLKALGCDDVKPKTNDTGSNIGAIAGGVVGGIGVLALIAGGLLFLRRRRAQKIVAGAAVEEVYGHKAQYEAKSQVEWASHPPPYQTPQLPADEISEAPVRPAREVYEMPAHTSELPGTAANGKG
ncbi:aspartic peptidase domain-containing protein [Trichophaea hybrida]|nr:aspartic peptidase domain-containing protein [Trichophaea hybrida]